MNSETNNAEPQTLNLKFACLAVAWMALIFALSAQPKNDLPQFGVWDGVIKKGGHLLEYAVLAWLWQRALNNRRAWIAWGVAVLYAASDELHQLFVAGRNAQLLDVGLDAIGAGLGLIIARGYGQKIWLLFKLVTRLVFALFDG